MKQKKQIVMSKAAKIDDLLDEAHYLDNLMFNLCESCARNFSVFIQIFKLVTSLILRFACFDF